MLQETEFMRIKPHLNDFAFQLKRPQYQFFEICENLILMVAAGIFDFQKCIHIKQNQFIVCM